MACLLEEREVADIIQAVPEQSFLRMASGHFSVDITSKEQLITHIKNAGIPLTDVLKFLFACMKALQCRIQLERLRDYCIQHSIIISDSEPSDHWTSTLCTEPNTTGNSSFTHPQQYSPYHSRPSSRIDYVSMPRSFNIQAGKDLLTNEIVPEQSTDTNTQMVAGASQKTNHDITTEYAPVPPTGYGATANTITEVTERIQPTGYGATANTVTEVTERVQPTGYGATANTVTEITERVQPTGYGATANTVPQRRQPSFSCSPTALKKFCCITISIVVILVLIVLLLSFLALTVRYGISPYNNNIPVSIGANTTVPLDKNCFDSDFISSIAITSDPYVDAEVYVIDSSNVHYTIVQLPNKTVPLIDDPYNDNTIGLNYYGGVDPLYTNGIGNITLNLSTFSLNVNLNCSLEIFLFDNRSSFDVFIDSSIDHVTGYVDKSRCIPVNGTVQFYTIHFNLPAGSFYYIGASIRKSVLYSFTLSPRIVAVNVSQIIPSCSLSSDINRCDIKIERQFSNHVCVFASSTERLLHTISLHVNYITFNRMNIPYFSVMVFIFILVIVFCIISCCLCYHR